VTIRDKVRQLTGLSDEVLTEVGGFADEVKPGDRITTVRGWEATVQKVWPDEGIAKVWFDQAQRGRCFGHQWHIYISSIIEVRSS
jgi:hypothetical protein